MNENLKPYSLQWWREKCQHEEQQKMFWMDQAMKNHANQSHKINQDLIFGLLLLGMVACSITGIVLCLEVL